MVCVLKFSIFLSLRIQNHIWNLRLSRIVVFLLGLGFGLFHFFLLQMLERSLKVHFREYKVTDRSSPATSPTNSCSGRNCFSLWYSNNDLRSSYNIDRLRV